MIRDTRKHLPQYRCQAARFSENYVRRCLHCRWPVIWGGCIFILMLLGSGEWSLAFQDEFELPGGGLSEPDATNNSADNQSEKNAGEADPRQQKTQLRELVREYSKARKDLERQQQLVEQILAFGLPGAEQFQRTINKRLQVEMRKYGKEFNASLKKLNKAKFKEINPAEIQSLQQQFWAVSERDDLTKEMIKSEIDPIIQRLQSMVVIERASVFASNVELQAMREGLLVPGKQWERCAAILHEDAISKIENEEARQSLSPPSFEQWLLDEEEFLLRLAMPMGTANQSVLAANENVDKNLADEEVKAILATNLLRLLVGRPALAIDLQLTAASRDHSIDMERLKFFSHDSPVAGKSTPWDRARNFGTTGSGENIAINGGGGAAVTRAWYYSPGHHKNMFGKHARIGVGKSGRHWTQLFGK